MPTKTPINEEPAGVPPARLPDEATLARLANELFWALPSSEGGAIRVGLPDSPITPDQARNDIPSSPKLTPTAITPTGAPDTAAAGVPATGGRVGGAVLSVPEAYAAALPHVESPTPSSSSASYYFLDLKDGDKAKKPRS